MSPVSPSRGSTDPAGAGAPGEPGVPPPTGVPPELVMFDFDYTLLRPGEQFEAVGYQRMGARFGLSLDPARWPEAERAGYRAVVAHRREIGDAHDDALIEVIARAVITGMGGDDADAVTATAGAIATAWSNAENFVLYEDVLPCLRALQAAGLRMVIVSNALGHDLKDVVAHFGLDEFIDRSWSSAELGITKPSPAVFRTVLEWAGVDPASALMVGDSLTDDVQGAFSYGCRAVLLDRGGRRAAADVPRIESLAELPCFLGLPAA